MEAETKAKEQKENTGDGKRASEVEAPEAAKESNGADEKMYPVLPDADNSVAAATDDNKPEENGDKEKPSTDESKSPKSEKTNSSTGAKPKKKKAKPPRPKPPRKSKDEDGGSKSTDAAGKTADKADQEKNPQDDEQTVAKRRLERSGADAREKGSPVPTRRAPLPPAASARPVPRE